MPSLAECHEMVVKELVETGERVLRPSGLRDWGPQYKDKLPDIYYKKANGEDELCIGHGIRNKDGSYSILMEFLTGEWGPFKLDDLGLVDFRAFYEPEKTWTHIKRRREEREGGRLSVLDRLKEVGNEV